MTDWQALDARIAREVMGCVSQAELVRDGCPDLWWSQTGKGLGNGYWIEEWQPHNDVAQALMALDAVVKKYPNVGYTLERATPKRARGYMCALGNPDAPETLAFGSTLREAICLAIEKWLDAQKKMTLDEAGDQSGGPADAASG